MDDSNPCCDDWREHFDTINSVFVHHQVRTGESIELEPFRYCPWCGEELSDSQTNE